MLDATRPSMLFRDGLFEACPSFEFQLDWKISGHMETEKNLHFRQTDIVQNGFS